jgi:hypothetical protein
MHIGIKRFATLIFLLLAFQVSAQEGTAGFQQPGRGKTL